MKKNLFLFGMMILILSNIIVFGQGSWTLQTNPTNSEGESMQFVSATEGWISLSNHQLLHTTNAGSTWNIVTPNPSLNLGGMDAPGNRVSFISATTGWVLKTITDSNNDGIGTVLLKTTDGGTNWSSTTLSTSIGDIGVQVQFVDANNGWLLLFNMNTETPTFLKTTNGGTTWTPTNGGGIFYYVNATTGYSFSAGPNMSPPYTIYKTTDGGTNWTPQYTDNATGTLEAIHFTDVNNGWIVGKSGKILKTNNGGTSWTTITNAPIDSNYDNGEVQFLNSNIGWIATRINSTDTIYMLKTINGGTTWTKQLLPFSSKVYSMNFWDENNGWATSDQYNGNSIYYPGKIARYSVGPYSNATLNGPWLFYKDLSPIDPFNDNLLYFIFDGNGNITDISGFGGPWTSSNYTVTANGAITGTLTNGSENFTILGQLTSISEGIGQFEGQNWKFHKIANTGALQDKIVGTLSTSNCGNRTNVTLNIDGNGIITSAIGLAGPVTGRVYADLGVYIGHMNTGEPGEWHELSIMGNYNNNNLAGQLRLETNSCFDQLSNLVRSNNLGINDNYFGGEKITIYPNPNNGNFFIKMQNSKNKIEIEIYNTIGHKVFSDTINSNKDIVEVNFKPTNKGLYFIKISDGTSTYKDKILIK